MKARWLWAIIIAGLLLRVLTINSALSFDEFIQTKAVIEANPAGLDKYTEMNPLTTWTRIAVTKILGVHVWSLRLTSLIFAMLTLWLTYAFAKELYDKKTAAWAAALLSLSALHALVSTSISFDGAFLTFYTLLTMYCYAMLEKYSEKKWLILTGISFGLCVLTKYPGVLVIIAIALYSLIRGRNIIKTIKECAIISIIGIAVFSIFPIIAFLTDPSYFWASWQHGSAYFRQREASIALLAIQYALAMMWIGPLLLFGYLLSWKARKKQDWIFHSLIIIILAFYTFVVQDAFRPVERYFTILLPALCILAGKYFASLNIKKWKLFWIVFPAMLAIDYTLSFLPAKILPFYPKTGFINAVASLSWNFLVPFTGDQGPAGLYISFLVIALAFITSTACFVFALVNKKKAAGILLAAGLSLSVFFMLELSLHISSPDISAAIKQTANYVKDNSMPGPYYTFRDYAMRYYIGQDSENFDFSTSPDDIKAKLEKGGTLIIIDFPAVDKNSALWKSLTSCEQKAVFASKKVKLGYVYAC
ncbi:MAG: glycosyltransferase family 39 protein [Candidatus Woesearchaeota archaeon]